MSTHRFIDFAAIKAAVKIEQILQHYALQIGRAHV